jgi:hypothetical protein
VKLIPTKDQLIDPFFEHMSNSESQINSSLINFYVLFLSLIPSHTLTFEIVEK